MDDQKELLRFQARQVATTIAVVIGLTFALLAFSAQPPQPVILLLGIAVAVIGYRATKAYWVARATRRSRK